MKKITQLHPDSRVWIYQANRFLSTEEVERIENAVPVFLDQWTSHGAAMEAAIEVFHNLFLVVAADESKAMASGCGIDKSVRFVKETGAMLGVDFFDRKIVAFGELSEIKLAPMNEFWAMRKSGIIDSDTLVFDNLVKTVHEFQVQWHVPFRNSWHQEAWAS